jgi:hypothetical protein
VLRARLVERGGDGEVVIVTSWASAGLLSGSGFETIGTANPDSFVALSVVASIGFERQADAAIVVPGDVVVDLDLTRLEQLAESIGNDVILPESTTECAGDTFFDAARPLRPHRRSLREVLMIGCSARLPIEPRLVGRGGWQAVVAAVGRRGGVIRSDPALASCDVAPRDPLFNAHPWHRHLRNDLIAGEPEPVALEPDVDRRVRMETELEAASPWWFFDSIVVINVAAQLARRRDTQTRAEVQGFGHRLAWFPAIELTERTSEAICLSHRVVIEDAQRRGVEHVLIFEDDVVFTADAQQRLRSAIAALGDSWQVGYLGGVYDPRDAPLAGATQPIAPTIDVNFPLYTAHAYVVHRRGFDVLLAGLPATREQSAKLVAEYSHIDNWYAHLLGNGLITGWLMTPPIAAQADQLSRHRFELSAAEQSRYLA